MARVRLREMWAGGESRVGLEMKNGVEGKMGGGGEMESRRSGG